jgi:hypothetical protein
MMTYDVRIASVLNITMFYLYYWFSVGEATLPLHHLIARNTPTPNKNTQTQTANHN